MIKDYEFAIISLDLAETNQWSADKAYKAEVIQKAEDMSDETGRTVEIYNADGEVIDTVSV